MSSPQYQQNIAKAAAAAVTLLALSGLTFVGTVIGLAAATPLLAVFSPAVVPAAVALFLMVSGLVVSGVCGAVAAVVFYWVYYCYAGGRGLRIIGAERAKEKLANAAHEMKQRIAAAAARLGSPAGQDLPVTAGDHENNLDRDIAVD